MRLSRFIQILEAHMLVNGDTNVAVFDPEQGACTPSMYFDGGYNTLMIDADVV
jgi:hypothetical protein